MASVQELILAAQAHQDANRPFKGLVDIANNAFAGYDAGVQAKQRNLDTTMKLLQIEQTRQQMEAQKQMQAEMSAATEDQTKKSFAGVGGETSKPTVLPQQKLQWEISQDEQGRYSRKMKTPTPKENTYDKAEYADAKGVSRIGRFNKTTGKVEQSPDDPAAPVARNSETDPVKRGKDLRNEFTDLSKDFFKVNESIARIRASATDPSAAGDLALIFNYMKVLDPGSVVRESEFATAQNSAGVPDRIRAQYNKVLSGERLAPDTRADFAGRAEMLFEEQRAVHSRRVKEYERLSDLVGADPRQVIVDPILGKAETKGKSGAPQVGGTFNGEKITNVERID
jgi:hypothetical protein